MECRRVLIYLCTLIRCWCTDPPWARLFLLFTTRLLTSLPAPECFLFSIFILAQWALKHGYKQNVFTLTVVNCLCRFYKHVLCSGSINQRFPSSPTFPCYIRDTIRCRLMYVLCSFFDGAQMPPCNQVAVCIHVCLDTYNTANVVKTLREISKIVLIAVLSKWYFWLIIDMHRFVSATKDLFNQQSFQGDECRQSGIWSNVKYGHNFPSWNTMFTRMGWMDLRSQWPWPWTIAPNLKRLPQSVPKMSQWLLMSDHQRIITSSLSPSRCLCQIWSSAFLLSSQEWDGRTSWKHDACGRVCRRRGGVKTQN